MNKKGFTLIEILAVLIALAIILVISIPVVTNILESARIRAFNSDAKLVLDTIRIQKDADPKLDETSVNKSNLSEYNLSIEHYKSLSITKENDQPYIYINGTNKWRGLKACGTYRNMNVYKINELGVCIGDPESPFLEDPNPGIICGEGTEEDYENNDTCYIYTVADLVAFSHSVNSGNNYLGKTVKLMNNIDIEDNSTYGTLTNTFGDINGNDIETETLDIELTTGEGFIPIGNNTINFQGTFEGNARTISNLYINRPTRQYTGLFGYNNGYIYGLNLVGINIEGNSYIGGLTGYNNGDISDIYLQGDVIANNSYAGGVVGYNNKAKNALSLFVNVNVEGYANQYLGGLIGRNYGVASGIIEAGVVNSSDSYSGYTSYGDTTSLYYSSGVTGTAKGYGTKYDVNLNDNLNGYDVALDTWIGGDNNSNGYYFDYNASGEIVIKSVKDYPMTFDLTGAGTVESPYIISNYSDWKKATLRPHTGEVFSLETDIDFSGNNYFYAMGSNANYFSGTFNGNGHTLSNITTTNLLNSGTFGYNNGNIYGLKLTGLNLKGNTYTGGITGYNNGDISDIYLQGNITSFGAYAGGVVGYNNKAKNALSLLVNVNVEGYANNYLGGLIGRNYGVASGIIEAGVVNSSDSYSGYTSYGDTTSLYYSSGVTGTAKGYGTKYDVNLNDNLNGYDVALDTWIGGDNNSNGYYFDYNASGEIVIKSVKDYPMTFDLTGAGTVESPYIISNYSDWKKATLRPHTGEVFSLETDIDFSGNNYFYAMGSNANYFSGTFNGNGHTLSNITTTNLLNSGTFGYNNGNIYGLKLTGLNLKGNTYTGGITGYNNGDISDIYLQGNITSFGAYAGGVIGRNHTSKNALSLLVNINLEGNNFGDIGGIVGGNSGIVTGVVEAGTINSSDSFSGYGYGFTYTGGTTNVYYSSGVTGTARAKGTQYDVNLNDNLNGYDVVLDTWIGGDNNSNGHYFDYNASGEIVIKSVKDYPMTFDLTGAGTVESPYIISNYSDWKTATLRPNSSYVFSLETDIDFSGNNYYYAMGSNANYFSGTFNGNGHTLSNITTINLLNSGTFGYNNGNIYGLKLTGLNLKGNTYTGGITGYNNGTVSDISVQGNITSFGEYAGGVIGRNHKSKNALSLLADVNIEGNNFGDIGGIVGGNSGIVTGVVEAGTINSSDSFSGYGYGFTYTGGTTNVYYSSGVTGTARAKGTQFDVNLNDNLNGYDVALDTWIGGDNNSNGHYFDYNASGEIVIKSVKDYPMTFDLTGAGTVESPYIISNYSDWKKATLRPNSSYVYSLETDIDFSGNNYFYAMGSNANYFSGTFNGNGHTLSNITTTNLLNSGTFGYNTGIIRGINIINLNLKGNTYTGGITGYNNGTVSDISVQGNITSFGECAGGVVGYNVVSKNATNLLVNINLEGNNFGDIGGTVGWNKGIVTGVVEAGTINSSHSNSGKGYGYASSGATTSIYYSSGVTGTARAKGTQFDVSNYNNLTSYDTYNLDTRIGGDNDSSGYYFDYNNTQSDIIVKSLEREPILILEPTNSIVSIRYGLSKPILDYYTTEYYVHPSQNINDVNIECRRARDNALVTNINELERGINVVTCEITFTNIYGSHTTGPQQVMFKHWYYATNPTYSCPNGYEVSWDDPDGTGEPVCRGIRASVLDIGEICDDYHTGSDNVRSTTLLAYRPSKGCYFHDDAGFAQFGTDLGIFNETPTFGHGWNDQNDGGHIFSRRGIDSWVEDIDNCDEDLGYYMAEPFICTEWTRGPDPTASGGTCNNSGTNDSGTTISPTLSSGRCYFD